MDMTTLLETIVRSVELLAVAILALGVVIVLGRSVRQVVRRTPWLTAYKDARDSLGRVLLLGLEVLIAADIIATVALELTLENVGTLGLVVLIRTFLSWAIEVETEGRWPWRGSRHAAATDA